MLYLHKIPLETLNFFLKLAAGVSLFLFAMHLVEKSLKDLSGRNFKLFLQRLSKNKLNAAFSGTIVTTVLQSSTMVSLMVLAFVGAGIISMKNALAIILGANIGTTIDSWLVVFLGFKLNIEVIAYPSICIAALLLILSAHKKTRQNLAYFFFGFGLLFIAISIMKVAMEVQVNSIDFSKYSEMPAFIFLCIGFLITVLIQSSSATMALTLSAIHAGAVSFPSAAAIVLGSETGTTIKLLLGSVGGTASKKRVTIGNLLFNILLTLFAFFFLKPILYLITEIFSIHDPLIGLATFSTLINILAVLIFLPFLDRLANFLETLFKDSDGSTAAFIGHANMQELETALDLFRKETEYFIYNAMLFNASIFDIDPVPFIEHLDFEKINEKKRFFTKTEEEKYEFIKQLQGELQAFYLEIRGKLQGENYQRAEQLNAAIRSAMYAVKSIKDIRGNISNLKRSSKDVKFDFFIFHKTETEELYTELNTLFNQENTSSYEKLKHILDQINNNYSLGLKQFYQDAEQNTIEDLDLTTAINFNRELFASNKALLMALKDFLLEEKQSRDFNETLVYIT